MAHAIEGYSRPNTGQTIQVKNQKKSTPASKPQTVKKNSSNVGGAVYTASRFEDVAKNKSTYTAKATYTNPVLAKKQSTIAQAAQSNKEAAKTTPNALSVAKNFFGGVVDAGVSTAVSLYNLGRHPVQTAKAIGTVIAHPVQTAEAIKEIAVELKDDFKEGNADVKAHMIGRAVGEIGLAIAGAKAVDIGAKALKTFKAAQATANGGKAGVVAEKLSEASKAADAVLDVAEKIEDEAVAVGQVISSGIKESSEITVKISKTKYPESAQHIEDAINDGHPDTLTINRQGAKNNRKEALKGVDKVQDKDLDEYPPAMFEEGGSGASVKPISPSDNRGAGSSIGHQLRQHPDGTKIKIEISD